MRCTIVEIYDKKRQGHYFFVKSNVCFHARRRTSHRCSHRLTRRNREKSSEIVEDNTFVCELNAVTIYHTHALNATVRTVICIVCENRVLFNIIQWNACSSGRNENRQYTVKVHHTAKYGTELYNIDFIDTTQYAHSINTRI